ncbi:MAG: hypothetical protein QXG98_03865 [Candidatus Micrarchaeia archaeon]
MARRRTLYTAGHSLSRTRTPADFRRLYSKLLLLRARASRTNKKIELEQIEVELNALGREAERRRIEPLSHEVRLLREHLFHKIVGDSAIAHY